MNIPLQINTVDALLDSVQSSKTALKNEINAQGGTIVPSTPFSQYATKLHELDMTDPEVVYAQTRPADWLPMPSAEEEAIYFLCHLKDTDLVYDNQLNFLVTGTLDSVFKVELGTVVGGLFVPNNALTQLCTIRTGSTAQIHMLVQMNYIDFADVTSDGVRQCMVKITKVTAGMVITNFNGSYAANVLCRYHMNDCIVDAKFDMAVTTRMGFNGGASQVPNAIGLTYATLTSRCTCKQMIYTFMGCIKLKSVSGFKYLAPTTMDSVFNSCFNLIAIDLPSFTGLNCYFYGVFTGCYSLTKLPLMDLSNATSLPGMFQSCSSLKRIDMLTSNKLTNVQGILFGCFSLQYVTPINVTSVTAGGYNNSIQQCYALTTFPLFSESGNVVIKTANAMFYQSFSISGAFTYDTSLCTDFRGMFAMMRSLEYIDNLNITSMNLTTGWDTNSISGLVSLKHITFTWTGSLTSFPSNIVLSYSLLDIEAVSDFFNSLPDITSSTGRSITLTGILSGAQLNNGSNESNAVKAIATNKGWSLVIN